MNDLVRKLTTGDHAVEASLRPEKTLYGFKAALDRGYVHVRFTETRGGTELGFKLDPGRSDLSSADFDSGSGVVKLCGSLTLDYEKVRCIAEIDLATLNGRGRLELLNPA
jgi:hypothetical protein